MSQSDIVPAELKKSLESISGAVDQLKSAQESGNAETKKNIEDVLLKHADLEEKHTRNTKIYEELKGKLDEKAEKEGLTLEEFKTRIADLETELAKGAHVKSDEQREAPEYKSFFEYFAKGDKAEDLDYKMLRTDTSVDGGYLVPDVMDSTLRRYIVEKSPMEAHARVRNVGVKSLSVPVRIKPLTAEYEGEGEEGITDNSQYGTEQMTVHRIGVTVPFTLDLLQSGSPINIEAEVNFDVAEAFAERGGNAFILGDGNKKPKGILVDGRLQILDTANAGVLEFEDMAKITGELKSGYDPMYAFNRRTLALLLGKFSTTGQPIWMPTAKDGSPATVYGYGYDSGFIDLPDPDTSNNQSVIFGDFGRCYEIYNRTATAMIRDDITRKKNAVVEFTFHRWHDGKVIIPEAAKILRIQ